MTLSPSLSLFHMTYADHVASGRCMKFIEEYMAQEVCALMLRLFPPPLPLFPVVFLCSERNFLRQVLPLYGNTHTTTSVTGSQSTAFRCDGFDC